MEFSAVIVAAGGGKFKLYQDDIKTIFDDDSTFLILGEGVPSAFPLIFHNHPTGLKEDYDRLNRYPSGTDWATATKNVAQGNLPTTVKLAIADAWGEFRIYNYSDKDYYGGLSQDDKVAGIGLPDAVTDTSGCVKS